MSSMYCGISSLRRSTGGRIPAGSIMTNECARNRHEGAVDAAPVGAAHEEMLGVREVRDRADAAAGGVVDADPGADIPRPRHGDRADVATPGQKRFDLVGPVESLVRERDEEPASPGPLDQVGERRPGLAAEVVGALSRAAVGPLAGDAVVVG